MKAIATVFIFPFLVYLILVIGGIISFKQNCSGYLKRAADANTMEMASVELGRALKYLESKGDTIGYTSVIYRTPDEDVNFWYTNLKTTQTELNNLIQQEKNGKITLSPVDKSNQLIKVRETLVDNGDSGTEVTCPAGMYVFPNNTGMMIFGWISFVLACVAIIIIF